VLTRKRRNPSKVISTSIIEIWLGSVSRAERTIGGERTDNRAARFSFEGQSLGPRIAICGAVQIIGTRFGPASPRRVALRVEE
jgi:CobQ-like glutamine amidotransferase family enzyme